VPFDVVAVDGDHAARRWLVDVTGGSTSVPQIFIDDEPIGGYRELAALERTGGLDRLLGRSG